jgi:hypothetical protein
MDVSKGYPNDLTRFMFALLNRKGEAFALSDDFS